MSFATPVPLGVVLPGTGLTAIIERALQMAATKGDGSERARRIDEEGRPVVRLGNGLIHSAGDDIVAVRSGILTFGRPNRFWVECKQRRYVPVANHLVIGVITARLGDGYKVDIGAAWSATIAVAGFEGTSKKNRPNLAVGDAIFARISIASKDVEAELVCFDAEGNAEGFGEVKVGTACTAATTGAGDEVKGAAPTYAMLYEGFCCTYTQSLQQVDNWLLTALGAMYAFEIIIGANGRLIVVAHEASHVITIANVIRAAQGRDRAAVEGLLKSAAAGDTLCHPPVRKAAIAAA